MSNRFLTMMLITGFGIGLAGCNTMEGLGQDVEAGGEKIEEEANENR